MVVSPCWVIASVAINSNLFPFLNRIYLYKFSTIQHFSQISLRTADALINSLQNQVTALVLHFEGAESIDPELNALHALCPFIRNLTDKQLDAVGESGGVLGINFNEALRKVTPENWVRMLGETWK